MSDLQVSATGEKHGFQPITSLPDDLVPTSNEVLKFAEKCLKHEEEMTYFNWTEFKKAVDSYPGDDLTFDKYNRTTINQQLQELDALTDKIAKFFFDTLTSPIDPSKLAAIFLNTLTNLEESSKGYLQFLHAVTHLKEESSNGHSQPLVSSGGRSTGWEYRVLISVPSKDFPDVFYSSVATIKIFSDVEEESEWWGFLPSTKKNFAVDIDVMEFVVKKGFKAPNW
ncbi:hypothetical protein AX16_006375 [Volvariella volvacea WC 439]|nr:hypothetical protein AX16_006375 [Volvariella volvacea WC 439]